MNNDWIRIYRTTQLFEANVVEALLKDNDIPAFVMNKQDSSYGVLLPGAIEIYIPAKDQLTAKVLIDSGLAEYN